MNKIWSDLLPKVCEQNVKIVLVIQQCTCTVGGGGGDRGV